MSDETDLLIAGFDEFAEKHKSGQPCKVCTSEYREIVDALLARGASKRAVSRYLDEQTGYYISDGAIAKHWERHGGRQS